MSPFPIGPTTRFERPPAGHLGQHQAAFTERSGGVSEGPFASLNLGRSTADDPRHVTANEARVLQSLGLPDRVARLRLEHGRRILAVDQPGLHGPADAIMTADPGLVLWLTVADCVPVILVAGAVRVLGHCGWRGVAAGLAEAMVLETTRVTGALPDGQRAWIGPGIGACCYPVGPDVARLFPESVVVNRPDPRPRLDLKAEIRRRLLRAGLRDEAIAASDSCTACEPARFFSHRRDGIPSGRMAAVCWKGDGRG